MRGWTCYGKKKTDDAFLFTGGQDVSPAIYGESLSSVCGAPCEMRDRMELILLSEVFEQDKPALGICRGIQFLNAALGGTLYQDLPTQYLSGVEHHQSPPYDHPVHFVQIRKGTPLHELLRTEELKVNSYHHQAIKSLSPQLRAMADSEDELVEAVYMPDRRFVWALQWHPEFSFQTDENSRKIFRAFVRACKMDVI